MGIGDRIYTLRKKRGLTLTELGDKVGVGASTVRKWETGYIEAIKSDKIQKLADALETTPAYLLGWSEDEHARAKDNTVALPFSDEEHELLRIYHTLPVKARIQLLKYAYDLEEATK